MGRLGKLVCLTVAFTSLITFNVTLAADITSAPFKCSACRAIADSLGERLMNEKPRNHLDVRHRLDKHGNRYGKVIEFAVSELRAIELLENLCQDLKQYQLVRPDAAVGGEEMEYWVKKGTAFKDNRSRGPVFKQQIDQEHKLLANFCHGFIELHEDEITSKILRSGSTELGAFSDLLCGEIGKHCSEKAGNDPWLLEEEDDDSTEIDDSIEFKEESFLNKEGGQGAATAEEEGREKTDTSKDKDEL